MIIDFHTHTFPDSIAAKAIKKLSETADVAPCTDGTCAALSRSSTECGIDLSVLLPIATRPAQTEKINAEAIHTNTFMYRTRLLSFGTIHPENEDYEAILRSLKEEGIPGIKLHPVYQSVYVDDPRIINIISCAESLDLYTIIHAGYDIGFPEHDMVTPEHIKNMLKSTGAKRVILAHMGGWGCWDDVEKLLLADDDIRERIYLDTAFSMRPIDMRGMESNDIYLKNDQFLRMVRTLGADRVLFGTDSPWSRQADSLEVIKKSGLSPDEIKLVLGDNAAKILRIM